MRTNDSQFTVESRRRYKPAALKLPYLVVFLSLFGLSIGLIENLLRTTERPAANNEDVSQPTSQPAYLEKRSSSESPTTTSTFWCEVSAVYQSQFSTLESRYSNLCSTFSEVFAPSSTSLAPALRTSFSIWNSNLQIVLKSKQALAANSNSCRPTPITTILTGNFEVTAGCASSTTSEWNLDCPPGGTTGSVTLNGTSLSTYFPTARVGCTFLPDRLMVITTRTRSNSMETTSTNTITATPSVTRSTVTRSTVTRSTTTRSTTTRSATTRSTITASDSPSDTASDATSDAANDTANDSTNDTASNTTSNTLPTATGSDPIYIGSNSVNPTSTNIVSTTVASSPSRAPSPLVLSSDEVMQSTTFTKLSYFQALFLAPLIAVIIKALYEVIISALKLVEPFHYIQQQSGAPADQSVLSQYLSSSLSLDVLRCAYNGHLLPLWSVLMYILTSLAPPLASAAMSIRTRDLCLINGVEMRCDPVWIVNLKVIRSVEAILAICLCMVVGLIIWTWRYALDIPGNPSSIASVAMLLNYPPLLTDLLEIDPDADEQTFAACLHKHRFWLDIYQDQRSGQIHHRITSQRDVLPPTDLFGRSQYMPVNSSTASRPRPAFFRSWRFQSLLLDILGLVTTGGLFGLLLAYFLDGSSSGFNMWFSSQGILPKLVLVGTAVLSDILIQNLEREVRITEPYRRLSLGGARPETTVLLPLNGTCWSNLPRCLYSLFRYHDSRMLWQTTVCIVACLGHLNIITAAGVLFTDAQTKESLLICSYSSMVMTGCMLLTMIAAITWWRRINIIESMPRRPETVAAVMSYLCGSSFVQECANTNPAFNLQGSTERQRNQAIVASRRVFKFEKARSPVDGRVRWTVDFDRFENQLNADKRQPQVSITEDRPAISVQEVNRV